MIKSTELRISNKLQKETGEIFTVLRLDNTNDVLVEEQRGLLTLNYNLIGIPLSEEILLKAGFEKCLNGFWSETEIFNVKIIDNEILVYLAGSDTNLAHNNLKNLHQLQNLIHALTGEELTINL